MYLTRICDLFSIYGKRNILSYATISTDMGEDPDRRMRTERLYDTDTGIFLYTHMGDYNIDQDIPQTQKFIITNKPTWYLENRNAYNVRYVPYYISKVQQLNKTLESAINNDHIVKINENIISTKLNEWNTLFQINNYENFIEELGDVYLVPTNCYQAVLANYEQEERPSFIKLYLEPNKIHVSCKNTLILATPESNLFTTAHSSHYYLNYDSNTWYWFNNESYHDIMTSACYLYNMEYETIQNTLCKVAVPVNQTMVDTIYRYHAVALKLLQTYEIDIFKNCNTVTECLNITKTVEV